MKGTFFAILRSKVFDVYNFRYETKASKDIHKYGQQVREAVVLSTPSLKPAARTPGSVKRRKTQVVGQPLLTEFIQKHHTSSERETLTKRHTVSIAFNVQRLTEGVKGFTKRTRFVPLLNLLCMF